MEKNIQVSNQKYKKKKEKKTLFMNWKCPRNGMSFVMTTKS